MIKKPKLDRTPHELCKYCGEKVWSMAIHMFCCPAMFPDMSDEDKEHWLRVEKMTQGAAEKGLEQ